MVKNASAAGTPNRTPPEELTALPKPHSWTKCRGGLGKGKKIGWKERRDNEREMRERKMEREEKVTGVAYTWSSMQLQLVDSSVRYGQELMNAANSCFTLFHPPGQNAVLLHICRWASIPENVQLSGCTVAMPTLF